MEILFGANESPQKGVRGFLPVIGPVLHQRQILHGFQLVAPVFAVVIVKMVGKDLKENAVEKGSIPICSSPSSCDLPCQRRQSSESRSDH